MLDLVKGKDITNDVLKITKKLGLTNQHPKFNTNQTIQFYGGYNNDIRYQSTIIGFKGDDIYIYWDCYWFPIQDDETRKIKIID